MLAQKFKRRDAETQRTKIKAVFVLVRRVACHRSLLNYSLRLCVSALIFTVLSCSSRPTDPRTAIPADSLVYLETSDLGKMLEAITSNPKFQQLARSKPDTSALNGIRLSIAVTGFQTSEEAVTEENSVLNFKPHFVAVAETNAWNYQALSFTENEVGEFVNEVYGGEVELVTSDKHGGRYFTWTAKDGRKAFALVKGSLIFFGNDESAIDSCINVLNGGADSIAKNAKVSALPSDALASGYISKDGVAQIANIAAVSLAIGAGDEGEVKNFIARVVPEIVRNTVTEVAWVSRKIENGRIEDDYAFGIEPQTAKILAETVVPGADADPDLSRLVPAEFVSTTRYNFNDAQIAWRSLMLTARTKTDQVSGGLLMAFSSSLFEPYGVDDPEAFLNSVGSNLQTARFDADGDEVAVIVRIKDLAQLKRSVAKELSLSKRPQMFENAEMWRSADGELAAAFIEDHVVIGEAKSVERCLAARNGGQNLASVSANALFNNLSVPISTYGTESDAAGGLVSVLSEQNAKEPLLSQTYTTETRFNQYGIERRTVSDLGMIGAIIEKLGTSR